jgi:hypothetical protein
MEENKFQEAIDNHKKKGIQTYTFTCESGEQCILREPSINQSGKILPYLISIGNDKADFIAGGKVLVEECWICGDDAIRKNEDLLAEVAFAALSTIKMRTADVKKN